MNTVELIKVMNNIPVKGEVCAKDLLPEKKPLDMKAYPPSLLTALPWLGGLIRTGDFIF